MSAPMSFHDTLPAETRLLSVWAHVDQPRMGLQPEDTLHMQVGDRTQWTTFCCCDNIEGTWPAQRSGSWIRSHSYGFPDLYRLPGFLPNERRLRDSRQTLF